MLWKTCKKFELPKFLGRKEGRTYFFPSRKGKKILKLNDQSFLFFFERKRSYKSYVFYVIYI